MPDYVFTLDGEELDEVKQTGNEEFSKHRLRKDDVTIDVSLVDRDKDELHEYIENRKASIVSTNVGVPSPYTAEVEKQETDSDHQIEFRENEGRIYGVGYAGPEYRIILEETGQLPRYRYLVTWRYLAKIKRIAEIELFVPRKQFHVEDALNLCAALRVE